MESSHDLQRSKSTGFLDKLINQQTNCKCSWRRFCGYACDNRDISVSFDDCSVCGSEESEEETKLDSGIDKSLNDGDSLSVLEQKVDKLSKILYEQHNLLKSIKEEVFRSNMQHDPPLHRNEFASENNWTENPIISNETTTAEKNDTKIECGEKSPADNLLNAIELKNVFSLDHAIRDALEHFLQSDDLKDHVASVTAECVKGVVKGNFCRIISDAYLPVLERSHRRLIRQVTKILEDSFTELEESSASLFKTMNKTSRCIRTALEKHQSLLEANSPPGNIKLLRSTLKEILETELKEWRGRMAEEFIAPAQTEGSPTYGSEESDPSYLERPPISPQQPADPERSIIDTLMKCAQINKKISEGDINGAFEGALSSCDLSLVMAACRAAEAGVCARALRPPVLLSLVQQLATDMVHDTQLKCRYLEEAMIHLSKAEASTRVHLPLVVGEVRAHLARFLRGYPKHLAARRIALIVMAADNLLK